MTNVEHLEPHNTFIPLSATVTYILETGEFRQGLKTVAQLGTETRKFFSFLVTHPNIAISYDELTMASDGNPDSGYPHFDDTRIRAAIKRLRRTLKSVSEGLDDRVETVKGMGYRWSDANAIEKSS